MNLRYCKERGTSLSAPPPGRPPKDDDLRREQKRSEDELVRNTIEGKLRQGMRGGGP